MHMLHRKDAFASPQQPIQAESEGGVEDVKPAAGKGRLWLLALLLAVLAGGAYFWFGPASEEPVVAVATQEQVAPVVMRLSPREILEVGLSDQQDTVRITGTLRPAHQTAISTRSAGTLEAVHVQPGDPIEQNGVIAELDTAELSLQRQQQAATIEATRAQLTLSQSQLETVEALVQRGSSPRSALNAAQSDLDGLLANLSAQEAQLATLDLNLANATIRAPFSGIIAERLVDPGQSVNPGTHVVTLVDTAEMEVLGNASLSDALDIELGQNVVIVVESLNNRSFSGTVDRINPVAAEGTRSLPVYLTLDNPGGVLRGGMFVTGQIVVSQAQDVIAVPTHAVLEDEDGAYVLAIEDDVLVRRAIETGREWTSSRAIEVTGGIEPGDVIVGQELSGLAHGMPVTLEGI